MCGRHAQKLKYVRVLSKHKFFSAYKIIISKIDTENAGLYVNPVTTPILDVRSFECRLGKSQCFINVAGVEQLSDLA